MDRQILEDLAVSPGIEIFTKEIVEVMLDSLVAADGKAPLEALDPCIAARAILRSMKDTFKVDEPCAGTEKSCHNVFRIRLGLVAPMNQDGVDFVSIVG